MSTQYLYMMPPEIQAHLAPYYKLPPIQIEQHRRLETAFVNDKNPHKSDLAILAAEICLSEDQVKVWFQHRLACWRQSQGLPANESSLIG